MTLSQRSDSQYLTPAYKLGLTSGDTTLISEKLQFNRQLFVGEFDAHLSAYTKRVRI